MSQSTWRASPTTAGRSIYSQYKPDHAKEWITSEDRRQQKGVYGSLEPDLTDGLTSYRDSLYRPTVGQHIEKKHNANSKTLAELRQLLVTSDMAPLTASSPDRVTVSTRPDIAASNLCDGATYSPAFVHKHHFGWTAPLVQTRQAHITQPATRPKDGSRVVGSVEYCSKVTGKLAAMSSRRP
mmetsp:Transcript_18540/g.33025  ORF Transcript_18540/g.33025 Transcript_18540/m.33025 type:complete len:182 (-) Transcript_18540:157-702(-)|eukprot:CAMPEP_0177779918 /NCGR_PEP_ID=MMETSP0491_2-20121128/16895_1 /TAXON_ID=63592 /ORGANISM="Tetraselmis chuii, Strain PLY429" /LENGTH=181 /DNA_ID=CAMNT_0019299593 /DNA_START=117 /DNA_END=662 /DNA_ORIENTATION=-